MNFLEIHQSHPFGIHLTVKIRSFNNISRQCPGVPVETVKSGCIFWLEP